MAWEREVARRVDSRRADASVVRRRGVLTTAAGCGVLAVVAAVDVLTPPGIILIGMTVLGPLVASLAASWRQTATVAVVAWATALLLGVVDGIFLQADHLIRLALVGVGGGLCVYAAGQRGQRQLAMERLAHVAEVAQEVMLRPPPGTLGHIALAGRYLSAGDEALIGGDLYETAYTPYGIRVIIGDVRGKGLEGIRLAAVVLAGFRESVWDRDVVDLARALDKRVAREVATAEDFVTALVAEFPPGGGVVLVNCGHHPPLRIRAGRAESLPPSEPALPLGLGPEPAADRFPFEVGDRLLLCTDGLIEGRSPDGVFFPVDEQVDALGVPGLNHALDTLLARFLDHTRGRADDDLAALLVERIE